MNENQMPQSHLVPIPNALWKQMSSAPTDRPIVVWCVHDADPYVDLNTQPLGKRLTTYGAFCEQVNHCADGLQVVEWGGAYDDADRESGVDASLPDWWFVRDTNFEIVANPILWADIPTSYMKFTPGVHYEYICSLGHYWDNPHSSIGDFEKCPVCSNKPFFKAIVNGEKAPKDLVATDRYPDPEMVKVGVVLEHEVNLYAPDLKCDKWDIVE